MTATKHIGLDSFRVRNCDPGADERLPSDRASRCWNDDLVFRCKTQLTGHCAPSWRIVSTHESDRRPLPISSVERRIVIVSAVTAVTRENCPKECSFNHDRSFQQSSSHHSVDLGLADIKRTASLFESVRAPQRIASFFDMFRPFFSWNARRGVPNRDLQISHRFWDRRPLRVVKTLSQNVRRTHSLIRVSNEKRNVDERPPTRGKPNRHR